jgi:ABC-2 type transport system permease protein
VNWRAVKAIAYKDLEVISQSRGVLIPLIVVPVAVFVALPVLVALIPATTNLPGSSLASLENLVKKMPAGLQSALAGYDETQKITVLVLIYFLAPMYLVVPLMVASVIAADSFAGEKERKTLEALLYTPTTDWELFVGKTLSAWLPAVGVAVGGFLLYGLVANLAAWPVMGHVFFPDAMWLVLVIWVSPAVAGLGLGTMVLVSSRAQGFQEAYQVGAAVVLPIVLLLVGQATGVMYFNVGLVLLLGLVLWDVDAALLWFGVKTFQRSELIARL